MSNHNYDGYGSYGAYWTVIIKKGSIVSGLLLTGLVVLHAFLVTQW